MRLLPEWVEQEAVILAWPHRDTDWAAWLDRAQSTYQQIITEIIKRNAKVLLLCDPSEIEQVNSLYQNNADVHIIVAKYNDTWVRDYGFLTLADAQDPKRKHALEFEFNGWGQKFNATQDNQVNIKYLADLLQIPLYSEQCVVEGGALEIDADGTLLSTLFCLSNPKRNGDMSVEQYEQYFADVLGASRTVILEHGHLAGDDTDGHIDTLARFTPHLGIIYQGCENRPTDPHFSGLHALGAELQHHFPEHEIIDLPLPDVRAKDGERLPASYANFLILNGAVLAPMYQQPEDELARAQLAKAYPNYDIVPIDCSVLVEQYGSLHCISMQVPTGVLHNNLFV